MPRPKHKEPGDRARRALLAVAQMLAVSPHQVRELHAAIVGDPPPRYHPLRLPNPAHLHAEVDDPELAGISERFHGTPGEVAVLDEDQRKPPPRKVVVIGEEVETVYRPDLHSKRGGIEYVHEVGDQGEGKPRLPGKRYVVTDGEDVWTVPGSRRARFDPDRGILG